MGVQAQSKTSSLQDILVKEGHDLIQTSKDTIQKAIKKTEQVQIEALKNKLNKHGESHV